MPEQFHGTVAVSATAGGPPVVVLDGGTGTVRLRDADGRESVVLDARFGLLDLGAQGNEGDLRIRDDAGTFVFRFDARFAVLDVGGAGNEGDIRVLDDAGAVAIHLDGGSGDIKLAGADVAEDFACAEDVEAGSLLVALGPDEVALTDRAHDRRVVGVVSGAGSARPALRLGSRPGPGRVPVAVLGRAWCKVDADHGPVAVGDLLTTSTTPGHAMRVGDGDGAVGAVVGKALGALERGRGLVPVVLALR